MTPAEQVTFYKPGGEQAAAGFTELRALYSRGHAEPQHEQDYRTLRPPLVTSNMTVNRLIGALA